MHPHSTTADPSSPTLAGTDVVVGAIRTTAVATSTAHLHCTRCSLFKRDHDLTATTCLPYGKEGQYPPGWWWHPAAYYMSVAAALLGLQLPAQRRPSPQQRRGAAVALHLQPSDSPGSRGRPLVPQLGRCRLPATAQRRGRLGCLWPALRSRHPDFHAAPA